MIINPEQAEAFSFLHTGELKDLCCDLSLPVQGKKGQLIGRILHFLRTEELLKELPIPEISRAKNKEVYPLLPETLMLKGAYKNNLETRLFFQKLIGPHFHFTAFGQDWIQDHWMIGAPPTYQAFAHMWQAEYLRRRDTPGVPKEEWAYIRFSQKFLKRHPHVSRQGVLDAWDRERQLQKATVNKIIQAWRLT